MSFSYWLLDERDQPSFTSQLEDLVLSTKTLETISRHPDEKQQLYVVLHISIFIYYET